MARSKESIWKNLFLNYLNRLPKSKFIVVPTAGVFNAGVGTPDVLGCINGQLVWIEFKYGKNQHLTPMQSLNFSKWDAANGICIKVWVSNDESRAVIIGVQECAEKVYYKEIHLKTYEGVEAWTRDFLSYVEQKRKSFVLHVD